MGSFVGIIGNTTITDDRLRREFIENAKKVLDVGGMMSFESVALFDRRIDVLSPIEEDDGILQFFFNYFEDDSWELAWINTKTAHIVSNKVGSFQFSNVVSAMYVLLERYTDEYCFSIENDNLIDGKYELAWLNAVLGKTWNEGQRFEPWKLYELLHSENMEYLIGDISRLGDTVDGSRIMDYVAAWYCSDPENYIDRLGEWIEDTDEERLKMHRALINIIEGNVAELVKQNGNSEEIFKEAIERIIAEVTEEKDVKRLGVINEGNKEMNVIAKIAHAYSIQIALKILTNAFEKDFWQVWDEVKERTGYKGCDAVPFESGSYKVMKIANYLLCTDDDRLYWWRPDDTKFEMSDEVKDWLKQLGEEYRTILNEEASELNQIESIKKQFILMEKARTTYGRVFPFKDQFEEFVTNAGEPEYEAAMILFEKLIERYKEEGSVINNINSSWYVANREEKYNDGRMRIKRYLALLANKELRKEVLGF